MKGDFIMLNRAEIKQNIRRFLSVDSCWIEMCIAGIVPILLGYVEFGSSVWSVSRDMGIFLPGASTFTIELGNILPLLCLPLIIAFYGYVLDKIRGFRPRQSDVYICAYKNYGRYFFTGVLQGLFILLWLILLIIPGIVAAFAYSMTYFIVHDNRNISALDALSLSKRITKGYKMDLFVLYLSFIPWYLLVGITGGIAMIYVLPYITATNAAFYEELKRKAIETGIAAPFEFGMLPVDPAAQGFDNTNPNQFTAGASVENPYQNAVPGYPEQSVETPVGKPYSEYGFSTRPINHDSPIDATQNGNGDFH